MLVALLVFIKSFTQEHGIVFLFVTSTTQCLISLCHGKYTMGEKAEINNVREKMCTTIEKYFFTWSVHYKRLNAICKISTFEGHFQFYIYT